MRRVHVCLLAGICVGWLLSSTNPLLADDGGVVKGKVIFKGSADDFKRSKIDTTKDPNCSKIKPDGIGSENVVLNKKTDPITVRNVMVFIKEGLGDKKFPPKTEPAVINQKGCQYEPRTLGVMAGQEIVIKNSDDTNHNIHFLPKVNPEFNKSQPKQDMEDKLKLDSPEAPFTVKCDVHPWMGCNVAVFSHPFFAVTTEEGTFELKGVPPGKYKLAAWHETFGEQIIDIEVSPGAPVQKDFTYEPKK
ncbi:MAG: carboxypeptidase regulatory-like domain-containing protein [Planctomycetota bacterium]